MLSPADVAIIGALALMFFGPEKLPVVARQVGRVVRDVQNTSQAFVREMERAADAADITKSPVHEPHLDPFAETHVDLPALEPRNGVSPHVPSSVAENRPDPFAETMPLTISKPPASGASTIGNGETAAAQPAAGIGEPANSDRGPQSAQPAGEPAPLKPPPKRRPTRR